MVRLEKKRADGGFLSGDSFFASAQGSPTYLLYYKYTANFPEDKMPFFATLGRSRRRMTERTQRE